MHLLLPDGVTHGSALLAFLGTIGLLLLFAWWASKH